jgi:hypothetical protein
MPETGGVYQKEIAMKMSILFLLAVLFVGSVGAAERPGAEAYSCVEWRYETNKTSLLYGYLRGIEAADKLTSEVIMSELWPTGHRVGSVVVEIDAYCRALPQGPTVEIWDIIRRVAREKNR